MRQFTYQEKWKKLLTPEIVSYLTQIHEFKGADFVHRSKSGCAESAC